MINISKLNINFNFDRKELYEKEKAWLKLQPKEIKELITDIHQMVTKAQEYEATRKELDEAISALKTLTTVENVTQKISEMDSWKQLFDETEKTVRYWQDAVDDIYNHEFDEVKKDLATYSNTIKQENEAMAKDALRVLGCAYKEIDHVPNKQESKALRKQRIKEGK